MYVNNMVKMVNDKSNENPNRIISQINKFRLKTTVPPVYEIDEVIYSYHCLFTDCEINRLSRGGRGKMKNE